LPLASGAEPSGHTLGGTTGRGDVSVPLAPPPLKLLTLMQLS